VLDHIAGLVEHQHRRRRRAAFRLRRVLFGRALAFAERARAVHNPDIVVAIDRDAGYLTEQPVVRQILRPERIDLELRHA